MSQTTTGESWNNNYNELYLSKKGLIEREIDKMKSSGCGKVVIWIDCDREDIGFVTRIETIEIKKYSINA